MRSRPALRRICPRPIPATLINGEPLTGMALTQPSHEVDPAFEHAAHEKNEGNGTFA